MADAFERNEDGVAFSDRKKSKGEAQIVPEEGRGVEDYEQQENDDVKHELVKHVAESVRKRRY